MDELYLDYDPRNAIGFPPMAQPGRPFAPFGPAVIPTRPPIASRPFLGALQARPQPQPIYYQAPTYYPQPVVMPAPASKLGRKLSDLTVGDVVPLLAQVLIAFRPMPIPPGDEGRIDTNVINMTKFVDAIARHFHVDQQLNAAGAVAGTFLR